MSTLVDELEVNMQGLPEMAVATMRDCLRPGGRQLKARGMFPHATEDELLKLASLDFIIGVFQLEREVLAGDLRERAGK